jgi:hypothetical protein
MKTGHIYLANFNGKSMGKRGVRPMTDPKFAQCIWPVFILLIVCVIFLVPCLIYSDLWNIQGTRFEARNCISEHRLQEPYRNVFLSTQAHSFHWKTLFRQNDKYKFVGLIPRWAHREHDHHFDQPRLVVIHDEPICHFNEVMNLAYRFWMGYLCANISFNRIPHY